ncbi:MAG TPA: NAD+ synthase [Flavobacteriales bacterium]|nr:NAD+ synthase [Flavobacteriales bacterium]
MKIALAQLNYHIGNFDSNVRKIKDVIARAKEQNADLVIFAELTVCGYPPRDFLEFEDFITKCNESVEDIARECTGIAAIIGAPATNSNEKGKPLYNAAYFLRSGKVESVHHKYLLPNYDVFDENRYFEPAGSVSCIELEGTTIAVTICEDLWTYGNENLYSSSPMDELIKERPDLIVNLSASPFDYRHMEERKATFSNCARQFNLPLIFVNHVGAQTELIFDGGSFVLDSSGKMTNQLKMFEEDFQILDLNNPGNESSVQQYSKLELIHDALVLGIRDYFTKSGLKKAILGLSGGIDSAVTLALTSSALGKENVTALLLPSKFSSDHSVADAEQLCRTLGCPYEKISIEEINETFEKTLKPYFKDLPPDITEENVQARIRAVLLMGFANKFGHILLNTSNKSEKSVGYGTMYGDMAGGLAILGDVYKTEVFELAEYINRNEEIIPQNSIDKPPSAELRPDQKDVDSLPEYDILDKILFEYIENRNGPKELVEMGFSKELVNRVLKLVNMSEYKRFQAPPILRVSSKAFGMGRRMPIVGKYLS